MVYFALRRDDLCSGPSECSRVRVVACRSCGATWSPASLNAAEACPKCGKYGWIRRPCRNCPAVALDAAMDSPNGVMIQRASQLLADLAEGFTIRWEDVDYDDYVVYEVLRDLRNQQQAEKAKTSPDGQIPHGSQKGHR